MLYPRPPTPCSRSRWAPVRALALLAGLAAPALAVGSGAPPPNVLVIMLDDVGVDRIGAYAEHPDPGRTPVIDGLAASGVLFRNAWGSPSCSPGRAAVLTGRHGFRTGVGRALVASPQFSDPDGLPLAETTLPELLAGVYTSWAVGKWHLSVEDDPFHGPLDQGFATHRGSFANLSNAFVGDAYVQWTKYVDGVPAPSTTYATSDSIDEAIALAAGAGGPWFLWLALNAPHGPFHAPPPALHGYSLPADIEANLPVHVQAMIEAADTELGRLFAALGPTLLDDTLVVLTSDNGTSGLATTAPFDPEHGKSTIYEGGLNVPLIIAGPGVVAGAQCDGLVQLSDLYATVAEVARVPLQGGDDSVSLVPYLGDPGRSSLRPSAYAEHFTPTGLGPYAVWDQALRGPRYKLLRFHEAPVSSPDREELYDLALDPFEQTDLLAGGPLTLEQEAALAALRAGFLDLLGPWKQAGPGLEGAQGVPQLTGRGDLTPNSLAGLACAAGKPFGTAFLALGVTTWLLPFKGGTFVPKPNALIVVPLDTNGGVGLTFTWPAGVPPGFDTWWQAWIPDAAGPLGFSATNALVASTL